LASTGPRQALKEPVSPDQPTRPLEGRITLVTGATRGIGRAVALGFAEAGAHVIATGRTQGALESLDDEIRARGLDSATLVPLDLKDGDGIDRLGGAIHERWGKLDVMVAAAGLLGVVTPMAQLDVKIWDQVMAVNLTANYRLIRSMDPLLRRSDAGRAIFLTSGVAANPRAFWSAYAVSKAGLEAMARIYADETTLTPVRVAVINPGPMRTRMRAQAFPGEDPMTLPEPEQIVPLIVANATAASDPTPEVVNFKDWLAAQA
jgi:NAD(P)-dependent dehydrogenase (short-subunit alcohol dehydrogenase family)